MEKNITSATNIHLHRPVLQPRAPPARRRLQHNRRAGALPLAQPVLAQKLASRAAAAPRALYGSRSGDPPIAVAHQRPRVPHPNDPLGSLDKRKGG